MFHDLQGKCFMIYKNLILKLFHTCFTKYDDEKDKQNRYPAMNPAIA